MSKSLSDVSLRFYVYQPLKGLVWAPDGPQVARGTVIKWLTNDGTFEISFEW